MAKQPPSWPTRRQLSLILPEPQQSLIEPIRLRLDPIQRELIPAHVTLCREAELTAWPEIQQRLDALGPIAITMTFEDPQELPDGCILLRQATGIEQFQALRQSILGTACDAYAAHLTLLHPRNASGAVHDLGVIAHKLAGLVVTFHTVSLVEQHGCNPWQVKGEYGTAG